MDPGAAAADDNDSPDSFLFSTHPHGSLEEGAAMCVKGAEIWYNAAFVRAKARVVGVCMCVSTNEEDAWHDLLL